MLHDVVVEPLGDKPVVGKRVELRGPVVAGSPREETVDVDRRFSGAPTLALYNKALELTNERGVTEWHLSLTHTDSMAMAVALAVA